MRTDNATGKVRTWPLMTRRRRLIIVGDFLPARRGTAIFKICKFPDSATDERKVAGN